MTGTNHHSAIWPDLATPPQRQPRHLFQKLPKPSEKTTRVCRLHAGGHRSSFLVCLRSPKVPQNAVLAVRLQRDNDFQRSKKPAKQASVEAETAAFCICAAQTSPT